MDIQVLKEEIGTPEFIDGVIVFPNLSKEYVHLSNKECNEIADYLCDTDDQDALYILINACQLYTIRLCWSIKFASDMPIEDIQQEIVDHTMYVLKKWKLRRTTDNPITNFRQNVAYRLRDVNRNKYDKQYSMNGQDLIGYRLDANKVVSAGLMTDKSKYSHLYEYISEMYGEQKAFIICHKKLGSSKSVSGMDYTNEEVMKILNVSKTQLYDINREIQAQLRLDTMFLQMLKQTN